MGVCNPNVTLMWLYIVAGMDEAIYLQLFQRRMVIATNKKL